MLHFARLDATGEQFLWEDAAKVRKDKKSHAGKRVEVVIRTRRSQRSIDQNRWLWYANTLIANELGYDKHERETLHYALVEKCFGTRYDEKLQIDVPRVRSSKLTTTEFSEYMEWLVRFAATELGGIVVPLPGEIDLGAIDEDSE